MSEKLEALLQAVIDAETDTSYHYASESLTEAAPEILALIKARTPAPEGEAWRAVPVEPTEAMLVNGREALMPLVRLDSYGPLIGVWEDMLAASPVVPVGWRDITTAPRDGGDILLNCETGGCAIGRPNGDGTFDDGDFRDHMDGFTHWMPLPPAPTDTGRE
jgi:hypothetical protein